YIWGFVLSIVLTLASFGIVWQQTNGGSLPLYAVLGFFVVCAIVQLVIQLMLFFHLGDEPSPRWDFQAFLFVTLLVSIFVGGSLWIMHELNHMQMNMNDSYDVFEEENIYPAEHEHHAQ